jgi:EAL domain-containing protein (putative c-di-GMP-specific phosphodiesterase class I)
VLTVSDEDGGSSATEQTISVSNVAPSPSIVSISSVRQEGTSIAGAIVSHGRALGLRTVADGIENAAQRRELERLGCPLGQGFLFWRPQPPEEFDALLAARLAA